MDSSDSPESCHSLASLLAISSTRERCGLDAVTQIDERQHIALLNPVVFPEFLGQGDDPAPDDLYLKCVIHKILRSVNPFIRIAENL